MAGFKRSITKGITTLNVKTNNFMEESKIKTYISTMEEEIRSLKQQIGEKVYTNAISNKTIDEGIADFVEAIRVKYAEIEVQKTKMAQLVEQERMILGGSEATTAATGNTIFCAECGAQNASNYKFCVKCGKPLN